MVRARKERQFPANDGDVFANVNGRLVSARRYRDVLRALMADQGGADHCSESRKQLFAASLLLLFSPSSWKRASPTAMRSTSQHMLCSSRPWCASRSASASTAQQRTLRRVCANIL